MAELAATRALHDSGQTPRFTRDQRGTCTQAAADATAAREAAAVLEQRLAGAQAETTAAQRAAAAAEARVALAEARCAEAASELQRLLAHTGASQQARQVGAALCPVTGSAVAFARSLRCATCSLSCSEPCRPMGQGPFAGARFIC